MAEKEVSEKNKVEKGCLYIVGTPIGNLSDLTERAVQVLSQVDFIAAEDTRVTGKLLNYLKIKKPTISYFEHNKIEKGRLLRDRIRSGESCALVSDAGMPAISDPGELLVAQCAEENIPVYVVPGPTAVVSALALSGLPTGRFAFEGFLSMNKRSRREHLAEIAGEKRTMVFYEAPHKLPRTLRDLRDTLGGERRIAVARELTKIHEEVLRTTLDQALRHFKEVLPKGEFVLVIAGAPRPQPEEAATLEDAVEIARDYTESGLSASEAAKAAAAETGHKKNEIYKGLMG